MAKDIHEDKDVEEVVELKERVRLLESALYGTINGMVRMSRENGGLGGYPYARLSDARDALGIEAVCRLAREERLQMNEQEKRTDTDVNLEEYLQQLLPGEQQYASDLHRALRDEIDSSFPEEEDYGIRFFRSLEILGVVDHFVDNEWMADRLAQEIVTVPL